MSGMGTGATGGRNRRVSRSGVAWLLVFGVGLAWITTISVLIITAPPTGTTSPEELVVQAGAALNAGDAEALAPLLAAPLDQDFATAYIERLQQAGAHDMSVSLGPGDVVTISGQTTASPFTFDLAAQAQDGRWYLTALPPV